MGTVDAATAKPLVTTSADAKVERVVRQLNALCKTATFDFAMSVGKLIINTFYSGDLAAWRNRGIKNVSFRRLAKHPDLPMSATALYRSTAIFEVCQRVGASEWKHVSTSHVRLVLPLPGAQQVRLLRRAEAEVWPVQRLREEIEMLPSAGLVKRGGRRKRSRLRKALRTLETFLQESGDLLRATTPVGELSPEMARTVVQLLHSVQSVCEELEHRLSGSLEQGNHV
jgi:hypothetical protein